MGGGQKYETELERSSAGKYFVRAGEAELKSRGVWKISGREVAVEDEVWTGIWRQAELRNGTGLKSSLAGKRNLREEFLRCQNIWAGRRLSERFCYVLSFLGGQGGSREFFRPSLQHFGQVREYHCWL